MNNKLTKSRDKMIGGTLAGVSEYLDLDPTIVRIGFAFLTVFTGFIPGVLFYIIMCLVMPN